MSDPVLKAKQPSKEYLNSVASIVTIRPVVPEDYSLIFNAWLRSYANTGATKPIATSFFYPNHHKIVDDIMQRSKALVAVDVDDPSQIFGFIVAEKVQGIVIFHYLYIKHVYRGIGIGDRLVLAMSELLSHDLSTASICSHCPNYKINPAALRRNILYNPYSQYPQDWKKTPPLNVPKIMPKDGNRS